jgi:hypothetical protein
MLEALEDRTVPSFLTPVTYPVGTGPEAIATADLNGDGHIDLVTANAGSNNISVLLGNSNGTFGVAQTYATGVGPAAVAVGDFNGDGKLDIVTANEGDNTVSVLLGNGDGTFQAAKSYAVGSQPVSVAVGDFDGKLDIVTANQGENSVSLLPGNGDGTFGAARTAASFNSPAESLAVGDFNGDGKLDLAVATRGTDGYYVPGSWGYYGYYPPEYFPGNAPAVSVLVGNGAGTLTESSSDTLPSPYEVPPSSFAPPAVTAADLTGNGNLDLVVTDPGDGAVNVLLNNGSGAFTGPASYSAVGGPNSVAVADLNGDGKLDLVTTNGNTVSVQPGDGKGAFGNPYVFAVGAAPVSVAAGDFNGDGLTDLAVANTNSNNVSILINNGSWPSLAVTATDPRTGAPLSSTTAGQPFNVTVTASDPSGNVLTGFTDTVTFGTAQYTNATIIDPVTGNAVPLQNFTYTFTGADHGTHTFSVDVTTAGTEPVTVSDPSAGTTPIGPDISVYPAAIGSFLVQSFPSPITAGQSGQFVVSAYDIYGNQATNYAGTVILSSSDPAATFADAITGNPLVNNRYTFSPSGDFGRHYFYATLNTAGSQSITATDSVNSNATGTQTSIQVNLAVTVTSSSAYGYINGPLTFTLGTTGDPAGTVYTYQIGWEDGSPTQTVTGPSGTTVTHAFSTAGSYQIVVTATDPGGLTGTGTTGYVDIVPITISIQTDPAHTSQQMLVINDGYSYSDITLSSAANNGVSLGLGAYTLGTVAPTNGNPFALVIAFDTGYGETIDARKLAVGSVLVGGSNYSYLYGGSARNLLIAGTGTGGQYAGSAGDILIGGSSSYDSNVTALAYIMAEWDSSDSYTTRVNKISKGGGLNASYVLNGTTVSNNNVSNYLYGGTGMDWFFAHTKGKYNKDYIYNRTSGEVATNI